MPSKASTRTLNVVANCTKIFMVFEVAPTDLPTSICLLYYSFYLKAKHVVIWKERNGGRVDLYKGKYDETNERYSKVQKNSLVVCKYLRNF